MAGTSQDVRILSPQQQWEFLFRKTLLFAHYQVQRLCWRGTAGGVLPDGYDPNSLAAQAIYEFLMNQHLNLPPDLNLTLTLNPSDTSPSLDAIQYELNRIVLKHVTRIHHRKENYIVSNVEDLAPVQIDDGDLVSPIELIPDPGPCPDTALLQKESLARFDSSKSRFASFIRRDCHLGSLFELLCDGVEKPRALAASLKLGPGTLRNLRKRLRRRWRRCFPDSRKSA